MRPRREPDSPLVCWLAAWIIGAGLTLMLFQALLTAGRSAPPVAEFVMTVDWLTAETMPMDTESVAAPSHTPPVVPEPVVEPSPRVAPEAMPAPTPVPIPELMPEPMPALASQPETKPVPASIPATAPQQKATAALPEPVPLFQLSDLPRFVHRSMPDYPPAMRSIGREGEVRLEVLLDSGGKVLTVTVLQSAGTEFDQAAIAAITASTFAPGQVNGRRVVTRMRIPVSFRLQ